MGASSALRGVSLSHRCFTGGHKGSSRGLRGLQSISRGSEGRFKEIQGISKRTRKSMCDRTGSWGTRRSLRRLRESLGVPDN